MTLLIKKEAFKKKGCFFRHYLNFIIYHYILFLKQKLFCTFIIKFLKEHFMCQKRLLLFAICLFCFGYQDLQAQSFYNWKRDRKLMLGFGLGTTNYYGDISNPGQLINSNPNVAINIEYPASPRVNARFEVMYYQIEAADSEYEGNHSKEGRYVRNLSFRANNLEVNAAATLSLYGDNRIYYQRPKFNPYVLLGIGATTVNPKAKYKGDWYDLRKIKTEGVDYSPVALVIPFGVGIKFKMTNEINMGIEGVYRVTFTDYLDDVSSTYIDQSNFPDEVSRILADRRLELGIPAAAEGKIRGNPDSNDGYFILSIKGTYYLPTAMWLRKMGSKRPKRLR